MEKVHLLYSCNAWHSWDSFRLQGVFTGKEPLDAYLSDMKKEELLTDENMEQLRLYRQTQDRERNYVIEEQETNPNYPGDEE
ncbi:hypothetical protein [Viscerimonas tarda]